MVKRLSYVLTDVLNTGDVDYLTDNNTAVVKEEQLPPVTPSGRRLLSSEVPAANGGMEVCSRVTPLQVHAVMACVLSSTVMWELQAASQWTEKGER